jgi:ankyrin repeat protein
MRVPWFVWEKKKTKVKVTLAHGAIVRGNLRDVSRLVTDERVAVARDSTNGRGRGAGATALHKAVLYDRVDVTRWLINNYPAVLAATDKRGRTGLHYAAVKRDAGHVYKILVNAGAKPDWRDKVTPRLFSIVIRREKKS